MKEARLGCRGRAVWLGGVGILFVGMLVSMPPLVMATHKAPFVTEVFYEWGNLDPIIMADPPIFSLGPAAHHLFPTREDTLGLTSDGRWDLAGAAWDGCQGDNAGDIGGGDPFADLPCGPYADGLGPYDSISIIVDDLLNGQDVGGVVLTCGNDDDRCGEMDNIHDPLWPGPNEIRRPFCGSIFDVQLDPLDDRDGTGRGIWDADPVTNNYEQWDGTYMVHPGIDSVMVLLGGPVKGPSWCPVTGNAVGATTGTITLIGR